MRYVINKTPAAGSLQVIGKPTQVPSPWVVLNPPSAWGTFPADMKKRIGAYSNANYATARAGVGSWYGPDWGAGVMAVGQSLTTALSGDPLWVCAETFLSFDLPTGTPSTATLSLYKGGISTAQAFTLEVRAYDFGATVETGDYVAGAGLGSYTLLGSLYCPAAAADGLYEITLDETGMLDHLLLCSDRHRLGNEPVLDDREGSSINTPELVLS